MSETIQLRGDKFDNDGCRFWQPLDFCEDFDRRPSEVLAAIERLGIQPKHDFGRHARLYGRDAFDRLQQHFRDEADLGAGD